MNLRFALMSAVTVLAFSGMAEDGQQPPPANGDAPVKASQTEVKRDSDKGTTATTQDATNQTNRAPNNEPVSDSKRQVKNSLPEYDSQGATAKENQKRDNAKDKE